MSIDVLERSEVEEELIATYFKETNQVRPPHLGMMTPRKWSKPLRPLTEETTLGYEVIEFATIVLGIHLLPWQQWLLVHALEINEDGTYRFNKLVILIGRQNGKTTLLTILALWWLYIDSYRFPERVRPDEFLILGTAQDLDTAIEAWERTNKYCDPDPENETGIKYLQDRALKPRRVNGGTAIRLKAGQQYRVKAATRKAGRGKSAARVLMDEIREQQNFDAWSAISKTKNAIYNSQIWTISNAGDMKSVVLIQLRTSAMKAVDAWDEKVETGEMDVETWQDMFDDSMGLFEWSAPEGCPIKDYAAVAQANPSLGYLIPWKTVMADADSDPEFVYRTEVLCQWVTAAVITYINPKTWAPAEDQMSKLDPQSKISMSVHVSANRNFSYIAIAGYRPDGLYHVEVIAARAGMMWVPGVVEQIMQMRVKKRKPQIHNLLIQGRGTPACELIEPLNKVLLPYEMAVTPVVGSDLGSSTGQLRDKVEAGILRHRGQPMLDLAVSGGTTKRLGDMQFWDLEGSGVDIAPLIAVTYAVFGLGQEPEKALKSAYESQAEEVASGEQDWWMES